MTIDFPAWVPYLPNGLPNIEQMQREFPRSGNKHFLGINDTRDELFADYFNTVCGIEGWRLFVSQ